MAAINTDPFRLSRFPGAVALGAVMDGIGVYIVNMALTKMGTDSGTDTGTREKYFVYKPEQYLIRRLVLTCRDFSYVILHSGYSIWFTCLLKGRDYAGDLL